MEIFIFSEIQNGRVLILSLLLESQLVIWDHFEWHLRQEG